MKHTIISGHNMKYRFILIKQFQIIKHNLTIERFIGIYMV